MSFLKFLKKGKKDPKMDLESLDVPPAPPDGLGGKDDFGALPDVPEFPDMEKEMAGQKSDFSSMNTIPASEMARPPSDIDHDEPVMEEPYVAAPEEPVHEEPEIEPEPEPVSAAPTPPVQKEAYHHKEKPRVAPYKPKEHSHPDVTGPIFIRIDRFKNTLYGMNRVRADMRVTNEVAQRLTDLDEAKSNHYTKWKNSMVDLQKKFMYIEEVIFKGDTK